MKSRFASITFMVVFCAIYALVFAKDFPMFRYYPESGDFIWGAGTLNNVGPGMAWYGFMAYAALGGLLLSFVIPDRVFSFARNYLWLVPIALMLFSVYLLRGLFTYLWS